MSYHVFFGFSSGLRESLHVPHGTLASVFAHIISVEDTLGLKRVRYENNRVHWDCLDPAYRGGFPDVSDEIVCATVEKHNQWVRRFYDDTAAWAESPVPDGEIITPEAAAGFWHGLEILKVAPHRWTSDYYRSRMESLYKTLRGRTSEGVTLDARALTVKQAASVINIISVFLDPGDLRLDVPKGCDWLASFDDCEYEWCDKCFTSISDDSPACRRRKCPLIERLEESS